MKLEDERVRGSVDRECGRLLLRARRLRDRVDQLQKHYEWAVDFAAEVRAEARADEHLASILRHWNWSGEEAAIEEQLAQVLEDASDPRRLHLYWDDDYGIFLPHSDLLVWRSRNGRFAIDVDELADRILDRHGESAEARVTYPILLTHQVQINHRAVARAVAWALVISAVERRIENDNNISTICLRSGEFSLEFDGSASPNGTAVPGAESFGYSAEGELERRIEEFDQVDPRAHWERWRRSRRREALERRTLRRQDGQQLVVELDRELRRLRLAESPASAVVRKRHRVFVDPRPAQIEDRYFADQDSLDAAVEEVLKHRIEAGYRLVDQ